MARIRIAAPVIFTIGLIALAIIPQAALSAFAFATRADPSWLPGVSDDADDDNVVALAASGAGNGAPVAPALLRPGPALIGHLLGCSEPAALVRSAPALSPRAPPAT